MRQHLSAVGVMRFDQLPVRSLNALQGAGIPFRVKPDGRVFVKIPINATEMFDQLALSEECRSADFVLSLEIDSDDFFSTIDPSIWKLVSWAASYVGKERIRIRVGLGSEGT